MALNEGWLKNAIHQSNKPKESIIGLLRQVLGGTQKGRDRSVLHASDVTKTNFCARKWALDDLQGTKTGAEYVGVAQDVTYRMGTATEKLLVEEWLAEYVVGNWMCRRCSIQRSMCKWPGGFCKDGSRHWWEYLQFRMDAPEYGLTGGIDAIFDVGSPRWLVGEIKILNVEDFEKIVVPQPEHRLRTNLYLKLIAESNSAYRDKFNLTEARVLYVSRGYGKMNAQWNEVLPFKEFVVQRDNSELQDMLQKAKALKIFRETAQMPSGICATALDPVAKKCKRCKECFSGAYPAELKVESLTV